MKRAFKVGDKVYLKSEEIYKRKRVWEITHITEDGVYCLYRKVRGFKFLETARQCELVLNR